MNRLISRRAATQTLAVARGRVGAKRRQTPGPALRDAAAEIFDRYGEPRR